VIVSAGATRLVVVEQPHAAAAPAGAAETGTDPAQLQTGLRAEKRRCRHHRTSAACCIVTRILRRWRPPPAAPHSPARDVLEVDLDADFGRRGENVGRRRRGRPRYRSSRWPRGWQPHAGFDARLRTGVAAAQGGRHALAGAEVLERQAAPPRYPVTQRPSPSRAPERRTGRVVSPMTHTSTMYCSERVKSRPVLWLRSCATCSQHRP